MPTQKARLVSSAISKITLASTAISKAWAIPICCPVSNTNAPSLIPSPMGVIILKYPISQARSVDEKSGRRSTSAKLLMSTMVPALYNDQLTN